MKIETAIEGLLFIVGDDGIEKAELYGIFDEAIDEVDEALKKLSLRYNENEDAAIQVHNYGTRVKFITKSEHHDFYQQFFSTVTMQQLSNAALEVLAIVAYNQPITRAKIEDVRGVNSDGVIRRLQLFNLIDEVGREDSLGSPILFGITNQFLDYFGLVSVEELPTLKEVSQSDIQEEVDIFMTKYQEQSEKFDEE